MGAITEAGEAKPDKGVEEEKPSNNGISETAGGVGDGGGGSGAHSTESAGDTQPKTAVDTKDNQQQRAAGGGGADGAAPASSSPKKRRKVNHGKEWLQVDSLHLKKPVIIDAGCYFCGALSSLFVGCWPYVDANCRLCLQHVSTAGVR